MAGMQIKFQNFYNNAKFNQNVDVRRTTSIHKPNKNALDQEPERQHSKECMCRLWNIAMCNQKGVTTGQTDGRTDAGQSYPYVPLCFVGSTIHQIILFRKRRGSNTNHIPFRLPIYVWRGVPTYYRSKLERSKANITSHLRNAKLQNSDAVVLHEPVTDKYLSWDSYLLHLQFNCQFSVK